MYVLNHLFVVVSEMCTCSSFCHLVPTRKEVQIMLSERELLEDGALEQLGAADWIAAGIRVEEMKCVGGSVFPSWF